MAQQGAIAQRNKSELVSQSESLTLVRNLLRTALSAIAYLRNLFPEDCFVDRNISGIQIKSLLPTKPEARTMIDWLEKGVFDALKRKYLKMLIFSICMDPHLERVVETYEFKVNYPDDGRVELDLKHDGSAGKRMPTKSQTKSEITQSMVIMLRTLITLAQTLKPVPETRYITMKLLYHDDITPPDYEPDFFRAATESEMKQVAGDIVKLKIGSIETQYHTMQIRIKTPSEAFEQVDDAASTAAQQPKAIAQPAPSTPAVPAVAQPSTPATPAMLSPRDTEKVAMVGEAEAEAEADDASTCSQETTVSAGVLEPADEVPAPEHRFNIPDGSNEDDLLYLRALVATLPEKTMSRAALIKALGISTRRATDIISRMERDGFLTNNEVRNKGKLVVQHKNNPDILAKIKQKLAAPVAGPPAPSSTYHADDGQEQEQEAQQNESPMLVGNTNATATGRRKENEQAQAARKDKIDRKRIYPGSGNAEDEETTTTSSKAKLLPPQQQQQAAQSPEVPPPPQQQRQVDARKKLRMTLDKFDTSFSQDEVPSGKVSVIKDPIYQTDVKQYRNVKEMSFK